MRVRRLSLIVVLVSLSVILLAAPVQAAREVTPFTFQITAVGIECPYYVTTGPVDHFVCVVTGTVVSSAPSIHGGQFTWTMHGPAVYPNPHVPGDAWGPVPATWQIDMPGEPPSGWQGTSSCPPWTDPVQWPDKNLVRARGNGFGANKNTHITWNVVWQMDIENATFSGEISETSK